MQFAGGQTYPQGIKREEHYHRKAIHSAGFTLPKTPLASIREDSSAPPRRAGGDTCNMDVWRDWIANDETAVRRAVVGLLSEPSFLSIRMVAGYSELIGAE